MSNVIQCGPGLTFEQRERAIGMLTHVGKRPCSSFPTPQIDNKSTIVQISETGNITDRPRSGRLRKTTPLEDHLLMTLSQHNRFLFSRKLGRLLRNATGTGVCDWTVRNRLHTVRLKACCPYIGIPMT